MAYRIILWPYERALILKLPCSHSYYAIVARCLMIKYVRKKGVAILLQKKLIAIRIKKNTNTRGERVGVEMVKGVVVT